MKTLIEIALVSALLFGCGTIQQPDNDLALLKSYCTISDDTAYSDDGWISDIFADSAFDDKQIIACGQSTHGSREIFLIQTSLFKKLVLDKGVRVFILEAAYSQILKVNEYVTTGEGSLDSIIPNLTFDIWKKEEMLQLIQWVKVFNETQIDQEKVLFLGCSVQEVDITVDAVKLFFAKYYPQSKLQVDQILRGFNRDSVLQNMTDAVETVKMLEHKILELKSLVSANLEFADSNQRISYVLHKRSIDLLHQTLSSVNQGGRGRRGVGDSTMAENVSWIVESHFRKGPVFLWAHNLHITFEESDYTKEKLLGMYLHEAYGKRYYCIGVDFISGTIRTQTTIHDSTDARTKLIPVTTPDSTYLNCYVANLGDGLILFNQDMARQDTSFINSKLYSNGHKIHSFGVVFNDKGLNLKAHYFNSIIFFPHSTPTSEIELHN